MDSRPTNSCGGADAHLLPTASYDQSTINETRLPVAVVARLERLVGGDPVTEWEILLFIGHRYGARSLFYLPPHVAEQVLKRPADFIRAAKRFTRPELKL